MFYQWRLLHILKNSLFASDKGIRLPYCSKRGDFALTNFLKIFKNNLLSIFTHHFYHLLNFFFSVRLIHATQKKGNLFNRQIAVVVKIDDIESLSNIIVWKKFPIDFIASSIRAVRSFADRLFGFWTSFSANSMDSPFAFPWGALIKILYSLLELILDLREDVRSKSLPIPDKL